MGADGQTGAGVGGKRPRTSPGEELQRAPKRNEAIGREQGSAVDLASGVAPAGVELPAVVPPGWERTPSMGKPIPLGAASPPLAVLMPMKVPIGEKWADKMPAHLLWTPLDAFDTCADVYKVNPRLVVDLTFSSKYYMPEEFKREGVEHAKIPCRGRKQVPQPDSVNRFVKFMTDKLRELGQERAAVTRKWQEGQQLSDLDVARLNCPSGILIHCTHGFNRTGYIIVQLLHRMSLMGSLVPLTSHVRAFAEARPPGIYKHDYIDCLYEYFSEKRPSSVPTPPRPQWKDEDEDDESGDEAPETGLSDRLGILEYDRQGKPVLESVGEPVTEQEETFVRTVVYSKISRTPAVPDRIRFRGSQPVSLERHHLEDLRRDDYLVTWKADGVRYILVATVFGVFLLNRANQVRRIQVRIPWIPGRSPKDTAPCKLSDFEQVPLAILDGELVADEDRERGRFRLNYLAYDLIEACVDGNRADPSARSQVADMPFRDRWAMIDSQVLRWRSLEKNTLAYMHQKHPSPALARYDYSLEVVRVVRKEFWELPRAGWVLRSFVPKLTHECDGLIYQGARDAYVADTHPHIMKWKFSHLNSVDFQVRVSDTGPDRGKGTLWVLENRSPQQLAAAAEAAGDDAIRDRRHGSLCPTGEYLIEDGIDSLERLHGSICECVWDTGRGGWRMLRERTDKTLPNAWSVYQSVVKTIEENISVEELVELGESKARPAGKAKDGQGAAQGNGGATVAGDANGAAKLD